MERLANELDDSANALVTRRIPRVRAMRNGDHVPGRSPYDGRNLFRDRKQGRA